MWPPVRCSTPVVCYPLPTSMCVLHSSSAQSATARTFHPTALVRLRVGQNRHVDGIRCPSPSRLGSRQFHPIARPVGRHRSPASGRSSSAQPGSHRHCPANGTKKQPGQARSLDRLGPSALPAREPKRRTGKPPRLPGLPALWALAAPMRPSGLRPRRLPGRLVDSVSSC